MKTKVLFAIFISCCVLVFLFLSIIQPTTLRAVTAAQNTPPATNNTVTLAWDANTETDIAGYKVYWGKVSRTYTNTPVPTVSQSAAPTFTTPALANGTWYFAVTAYNTAGLESVYSNEVSKTISSAPAAPKNLRFWQQLIALLKGIFTTG